MSLLSNRSTIVPFLFPSYFSSFFSELLWLKDFRRSRLGSVRGLTLFRNLPFRSQLFSFVYVCIEGFESLVLMPLCFLVVEFLLVDFQ